MRTIQSALFAALLAWALPLSAADPVAFFTNLKGEVALDGNPRPLLLAELSRGQKITLGPQASASVMFIASGKEYLLKGPAEFQIKDSEVAGSTPLPPQVRGTEWRTNSKVLVQVAQTSAASVRMRSLGKPREGPRHTLLFPTEGKVATLQPMFRWRAADDREQGELTVLEVGSAKPAHLARASGGSYRLPAMLKPDTEYAWSYAVGGNEVGSGRFRTLPAASLREVDRRRPDARAAFSDRVLFALLLQDLGAVQEAREVWARLAEERADLPELAALAK